MGHRLDAAVWCVAFAACTPTTMTSSSLGPDAQPVLGTVLVVGEAPTSIRHRTLENSVAAALESQGLRAVRSHDVAPSIDASDRGALSAAATSVGAQAVWVARFVGIDYEPRTDNLGNDPMFFIYYAGAVENANSFPLEIVELSTDLLVVGRNEPIWTASTETFAPVDLDDCARSYAERIVKALDRQGLLAPGG